MDTPLPPQSAEQRSLYLHWQHTSGQPARTCHAAKEAVLVFHGIATASKAAFGVVVAAHSLADGRDATPVLRARRVPRVGEDEDAPRDGALLSGAEAGDVPAAARLPPGAVLTLERHGVAELRVGTTAAAADPGGRRGGAGGGGAGVGARGPRQLGLLSV